MPEISLENISGSVSWPQVSKENSPSSLLQTINSTLVAQKANHIRSFSRDHCKLNSLLAGSFTNKHFTNILPKVVSPPCAWLEWDSYCPQSPAARLLRRRNKVETLAAANGTALRGLATLDYTLRCTSIPTEPPCGNIPIQESNLAKCSIQAHHRVTRF